MNVKYFFLLFVMFMTLVASASAYTINGSSVYIDDANVYMNANPHTMSGSGYVYVDLQTKAFTGNIDFAIGTNTSNADMTSFEIYRNVTGSNGTQEMWVVYNLSSINYTYDGKTEWNYGRTIPVTAGRTYQTRFYLSIIPETDGKYDIAVKPSAETIPQAITNGHFYMIDPWWNSSVPYNPPYPPYYSAITSSTSTTRTQPIFPYQNNIRTLWGFEQNANDEVGRLPITLNGCASYVTGKVGYAVNCSGTSEATTTMYKPENIRTVNIWMNPRSGSNLMFWTLKYTNSNYSRAYYDATGTIYWDTSGYTQAVTPTGALTFGNWQMVTLVMNSTYKGIYIDGILKINISSNGIPDPSQTAFMTSRPEGDLEYQGLLDEYSFYDRQLNDSEILYLLNNGSGRKYQEVRIQQEFLYKSNIMGLWLLKGNLIDETYKNSMKGKSSYNWTYDGYINFTGGQEENLTSNANPALATENYSYGGWVKPSVLPSSGESWYSLFGFGLNNADCASSRDNSLAIVYVDASNFKYQFGTGCFGALINSGNYLNANMSQERFLVVSKNATTFSFYLDSVLLGSSGYRSTGVGATYPFATKVFSGNQGNYRGQMKNLFVLNRSVSQSEVAYMYNNGAGRLYNDTANQFFSNIAYSKRFDVTNVEQDMNNVTIEIRLNPYTTNYNAVMNNGSNIRVRSNSTQLNYWRKSWNNSGESILEVLIPYIANNTIMPVYVDFNDAVADYSNESSVYPILYDDFNTGSVPDSKWNYGLVAQPGYSCSGGSSVTVTGGVLSLKAQAATFAQGCTAYARTNNAYVPINMTKNAYEFTATQKTIVCSGQGCYHPNDFFVSNYTAATSNPGYGVTYFPTGAGFSNYGNIALTWLFAANNKSGTSGNNFYNDAGGWKTNASGSPTPANVSILWRKNNNITFTVTQGSNVYSDNGSIRNIGSNLDDMFLHVMQYEDQTGVGVTQIDYDKIKIKQVFATPIIVDASREATGGTITRANGYTIHTFTTSGIFDNTLSKIPRVEVLVVGGGGGGGSGAFSAANGGGGGAGGVIYNSSFRIMSMSYPVAVGTGGASDNNGQNSSFSSLIALGGGKGGTNGVSARNGTNGGSGGGGANTVAGTGWYGNGTPGQGNNGGYAVGSNSGGGGGSGTTGYHGNVTILPALTYGYGGLGSTYDISGTPFCYAGGGGGGADFNAGKGQCGGGTGSQYSPATVGTAATGYGSGGGGGKSQSTYTGFAGSNGIVIIRYPTPTTDTTFSALLPNITDVGGNLVRVTATADKSTLARARPVYPFQDSLVFAVGAENTPADEIAKANSTMQGTVAYAEGKVGNAFYWASNNNANYIMAPVYDEVNAQSLSVNATIIFWMKHDSVNSVTEMIFEKRNGDTSQPTLVGLQTPGNLIFFQQQKYVAGCQVPGTPQFAAPMLFDNNWHMVTITKYNSDYWQFYIDNVLYSSGTYTGYVACDDTGFIRLGRTSYSGSTASYHGYLDEFRIYRKYFSADDVNYMYNLGAGRKYQQMNVEPQLLAKENLIGYWPLTENNSLDYTFSRSGNEIGTFGKSSEGYYFPNTMSGSAANYIKLGATNWAPINNITISVWINFNKTAGCTGECDIFAIQGPPNWNIVKFGIHTSYPNKIFYYTGDGPSNSMQILSTNNVTSGVWYNIIAKKMGSSHELWINGVNVTNVISAVGSVGTITVADRASIGSEFDNRPHVDAGINATLRDVMVWNTSVDPLLIYNTGRGRIYDSSKASYYNDTPITTYGSSIVVNPLTTNTLKYTTYFNSSQNALRQLLPNRGGFYLYEMNLTSNPIVNNYVTSFVIDKTSGVVVVPNTPLNYTYTNNTQPTFTYNITRDSEYLDHVDLIINNSLYGTSKSETCYQEDPTVANQTGIDTPNCGLKYTGVKVQGSPQGSMLYENYTKPAGATGATWRVSYGTTTLSAPPLPNEYVLPSACWSANANTTSVRVHIESGCGSTTSTQADCYNGTAWFTLQDKTSGTVTCTAGGSIGTVWDGNWSTGVFTSSSYTVWSTTTGPYFFEDAMIWNVPSSVTPNASLSTSTNYPWLFNYTETETQSVYSTETRSLYITGSGGGSGNVAQKSCIGFANGCSVSYTAGCGQ